MNILDSDKINRSKKLTDFQLVGIMEEDVKYPVDLLEEVKLELENREISKQQLVLFQQKYQSKCEFQFPDFSLIKYQVLVLCLVFLFVNKNVNIVRLMMQFVVILGSLAYVRYRSHHL